VISQCQSRCGNQLQRQIRRYQKISAVNAITVLKKVCHEIASALECVQALSYDFEIGADRLGNLP
jgi:hypothetical protein